MHQHTPSQGLADVTPLGFSPSLSAVRRYRCAAGVPWYGSVVAVTLFAIAGLFASFALSVILSRLLSFPDGSLLMPLIVVGVPTAYAALTLYGYLSWLVWRIRDVRLYNFAASHGFEFADRVETGARAWFGSPTGTEFPKHTRNVLRASFIMPVGAHGCFRSAVSASVIVRASVSRVTSTGISPCSARKGTNEMFSSFSRLM